jgi:hypothetical protein
MSAVEPSVTLECPEEVPSEGPIPLRVKLTADMRTYYDNDGILPDALELILVRRDKPGVRFVAKVSPYVWLYKREPLPRPSDEEIERDTGRVSEENVYDPLDYGATHPGSADYYALAAFASAVDGPKTLRVTSAARSLPSGALTRAPILSPEAAAALPPPIVERGVVAQVNFWDGELFVQGWLRTPIRGGESVLPGLEAPPFVTVVAVRLDTRGGTCAGAFTIPNEDIGDDGEDHVSGFAIPLSWLVPPPLPGDYRIFVFAADEKAPPIHVAVPEPPSPPTE